MAIRDEALESNYIQVFFTGFALLVAGYYVYFQFFVARIGIEEEKAAEVVDPMEEVPYGAKVLVTFGPNQFNSIFMKYIIENIPDIGEPGVHRERSLLIEALNKKLEGKSADVSTGTEVLIKPQKILHK